MRRNGVIFIPDRNMHGKKDMTGAFRPEARKFAKAVGVDSEWIVPINTARPRRYREKAVLAAIEEAYDAQGRLAVVAFFCHGYRYRLQVGFGTRYKVDHVWLGKLASTIVACSEDNVAVPLYACSAATSAKGKNDQAAAGDGGFADELRDALCREGAVWNVVMGHTTAGHTTKNPYVRMFSGEGSPDGGFGGHWIARPGSPTWRRWVKWLRAGTNRFEFAMMNPTDIRQEI